MGTLILLGALAGCGQDSGYLYDQKLVQDPAAMGERTPFSLPLVSYSRADWFFPCDANTPVPTAASGGTVLANAQGQNSAYRRQFYGTPINFTGDICPAKVYPRDVVILVDVSSGVGFSDSDPLTNGGCKRLTAVEALIGSLGAGAQVKVATFDENVLAASTAWFSDKSALETDLIKTQSGATTIADVLCAATGLPYNDVGLQKAKDMLASGRGAANANEELYIMTDGDNPFASTDALNQHHTAGDTLLTAIKATGVTVSGLHTATAAIDTWLPTVVSSDKSTQALDDDIANTVAVGNRAGGYAVNNIEKATVSYRVVGATTWNVEDVKSAMTLPGGTFTFPVPALAIDRTQKGWEAKLDYIDTHGNAKTVSSTLTWLDD